MGGCSERPDWMGSVDLADLDALTAPAGAALLAELGREPSRALEDPLPLLQRLRGAGHAPSLASAALTQARLRVRARTKFGPDADVMLFTPDGYEQATRRSVADHRAARLAAAGHQSVADLCCGVGGDAIAFARAGLRVIAVDRDPLTVAVARINLTALGLADLVTVHQGDAQDALASGLLDDSDAAFVDPARRGGRGRVFDPGAYSPPFSFVRELAARFPATVAKVAPGIPHELAGNGIEAEWVSDGGEVKEAALWHGPLATPDVRRRATLLPSGSTLTDLEPEARHVHEPGHWLHEPDGAVVRAGLVGQVAARLSGGLVDATIAYVTTDIDGDDPFTKRYEVLADQPFGLKQLRATLRAMGFGDVVVKKRGSAIDPIDLRRRLALDGRGPTATIVVTRKAGAPWTFITRPA